MTSVLLYDSHCRLCSKAAREFKQLTPSGSLALVSFRDEGVLERYPSLNLERCEKAMQLIREDGRVFQGAEAIVQALRPRWFGKLALAYYAPGLRQLVDALYAAIARNRFRLAAKTCTDGTCALHLE